MKPPYRWQFCLQIFQFQRSLSFRQNNSSNKLIRAKLNSFIIDFLRDTNIFVTPFIRDDSRIRCIGGSSSLVSIHNCCKSWFHGLLVIRYEIVVKESLLKSWAMKSAWETSEGGSSLPAAMGQHKDRVWGWSSP